MRLKAAGGSAVTVALGAMLLRLAVGDTYQRYVRVGMRPYLLLAGGLLVLMGLLSLKTRSDHTPRAGLLLLVPLLTVFLVSPPGLGGYAAARTAVLRSQLMPATSLPAPDHGAVDLTVGDFSDRVSFGQDLTQGKFRVEGFVVDDPKGLPGRFLLTRLKIVCCAADAQTSQIPVVDAPSVPKAGTWLTVIGSEVVDDEGYPELQALQVQPVKTPPDPYES